MITIIGSAHVLDIAERVKKEIKLRNPEIVAVELDKNRYIALRSGETDTRGLPLTYRLLAYLQRTIAEKFGVTVGGEMLAAVDAAQEIGAGVAFIDIPSDRVFQRLMTRMSLKEKMYLVVGMIVGLFTSKEKIEEEVENYQSGGGGNHMITVEEKLPTIAEVLIDERNEYMARNLLKLQEKFGSVVAVVGDGHLPGLIKEIGYDSVDVVRLKDLRSPEKYSNGDVSYSFSYTIEKD
ncbi:MAG: TraB/GumN family protein [Thermoplasmatota archaeon]